MEGHRGRAPSAGHLVFIKVETDHHTPQPKMFRFKSSETLSETLLNDGIPCDVTFICKDNVPVKAHKIVLALASKFFAGLFTEQKPHKMTTIQVKDINAETMFRIVNLCCNNNEFAPFSTDSELLEFTGYLPSFGLTLADFHVGDLATLEDDIAESVDGDSMTVNYGSDHDSSLLNNNYQNYPGSSSSGMATNPLSLAEEPLAPPRIKRVKFEVDPEYGSPPLLLPFNETGEHAVSPDNQRYQAGSTNSKRKQPKRQASQQVKVKTQPNSNLQRKEKKAKRNNNKAHVNNKRRMDGVNECETMDGKQQKPSRKPMTNRNEVANSVKKTRTLTELPAGFGDSPIDKIVMDLNDVNSVQGAKFCPVCKKTEGKFNEVSYCLERIKIYRCSICFNTYKSKEDKDLHTSMCHKNGQEKYNCPLCTREFGGSGNVLQHLACTHWGIKL